MARYTTSISINTGEDSYSLANSKNYNEYTKIEKEFDNVDTFNTLVEFDWDGISDNFRDCKGILICNTGETAVELQLVMEEWTSGASDTNAGDSYNNTFLPVGECIYLPHNRIVGYNGATSAGGGTTNQFEASVSYITSGLTTAVLVNDGSGTTTGDASAVAGLDAITVDGASAYTFHPGDYLTLDSGSASVATEVVKVVSVDSATQITVKRGQLGTSPVAHADDTTLFWHNGNSYIPVTQSIESSNYAAVDSNPDTITDSGNTFLADGFKAGDIIYIVGGGANGAKAYQVAKAEAGTLTLHSNNTLSAVGTGTATKIITLPVHTDIYGRFHISHFFGNFRYAAATDIYQGLVPGSVAIQFAKPAELKLGLNNLTNATKTNLTASTTYTFKLTIDGHSEDLSVTTDASNSTFTGKNGLIEKLQDVIDTAVDENKFPFGASVVMSSGDLSIRSKTSIGSFNGFMNDKTNLIYNRGSSYIDLAATGSGTSLLGSGIIPKGGFKEIYCTYEDTQIYETNNRTAIPNLNDFLIDRGDGTMVRKNGGSATIDYNTGAIDMQGCPPNSEFRVWGTGASALSGVMRTDDASSNCIEKISARSMNPIANAKVTCILLS